MSAEQQIASLTPYVSQRRLERMQQVLVQRTRYITCVVEDIFQPHNASAVLRSADAFGVQDVHIIENRNEYSVNPKVELGTAQWLTLHHYRRGSDRDEAANTLECLRGLQAQGYRVVATSPHHGSIELDHVPLEPGPVAVLFGTELEGLSQTALSAADLCLQIPMVGFVESLNISVSAALVLRNLSARLRAGAIAWQLGADEQQTILAAWLRNSVKHSDQILARAASV